MSETANIASISEILSGKLFGVFGWKQFGPTNFNFREDEGPEVTRRAKYPCDVVFGYMDPYSQLNVYFLTDLKSYKKSTIETKDFKSAITRLSGAVRKAGSSKEFQDHLPDENGEIHGLLFVYNHDNEYDKDLLAVISADSTISPDIPPVSSISIFSPDQIQFMNDMYNDLEKIFGEDVDPVGKFHFFYPNLTSQIPEKNEWYAATKEMLLSAYVPVLYLRNINEGGSHTWTQKYLDLYYRGEGRGYEEFCFIFEFLFRYNLIDDHSRVRIKIRGSSVGSQSAFQRAKSEFLKHFYKEDGALEKLQSIELKEIPTTIYSFHEVNIGMDKRREFANASY